MAPVGIYPTGAVALYGGHGAEARRACGGQDCFLLAVQAFAFYALRG